MAPRCWHNPDVHHALVTDTMCELDRVSEHIFEQSIGAVPQSLLFIGYGTQLHLCACVNITHHLRSKHSAIWDPAYHNAYCCTYSCSLSHQLEGGKARQQEWQQQRSKKTTIFSELDLYLD